MLAKLTVGMIFLLGCAPMLGAESDIPFAAADRQAIVAWASGRFGPVESEEHKVKPLNVLTLVVDEGSGRSSKSVLVYVRIAEDSKAMWALVGVIRTGSTKLLVALEDNPRRVVVRSKTRRQLASITIDAAALECLEPEADEK